MAQSFKLDGWAIASCERDDWAIALYFLVSDWAIVFWGEWLGDRVFVRWMSGRSHFLVMRLGDMRTKLNMSFFLSLSHKQDREYRN